MSEPFGAGRDAQPEPDASGREPENFPRDRSDPNPIHPDEPADASGAEPLSDADLDAVMAEVHAGTLETIVAERDDYLDSLRRLQADFENYKKRVARQQIEQIDRAAAGLIDKLLPVLDTADLALTHGAGDDVAQLRLALLAALEKEGLDRLDPLGEAFDPNVADAVAHEPGEGTMTVAEVMRAGYRWKGRVLRPAMVKVRG